MRNDLFKKLRQWEKEDNVEIQAETSVLKFGDRIKRLKSLRTQLDILLGSMVTTLIFCVGLLIAHGLKVI